MFKEGKKFSTGSLRVFFMEPDAKSAQLQFGAGAGTKTFKKAVDRNRVKRLIRETWRLQKLPLQDLLRQHNKGLIVFIIYTEKELPEYPSLYADMNKVISKLTAISVPLK